jgi:hypothetical protein
MIRVAEVDASNVDVPVYVAYMFSTLSVDLV